MKKLFAVLLACGLCSSGLWAQTAEEYNEQVGNSTDSLHLMAIMWVHACQEIGGEHPDYQSLAPARRSMEKFIKQQITRFKQEPEVEGTEELRKSLVALYEFEQTLVKEGFMPYEKLKSAASRDEVGQCRNKLTSLLRKEPDLLAAFNVARRDFLKRNNLEITKKQDAPKPAFLRSAPKPKPKPVQEEPVAGGQEEPSAPRPAEQPKPAQERARPEPRRTPEAAPQSRPTSSGNPNNKMPAKDEPKPKPKDEDEEESSEGE